MPPFGRSDFLFLNSSSFSSKANEIENLKCTAGNLHRVTDDDDETTGFVVNKKSSSPLQAKLQDLTAKADNVTLKIRQKNETHTTPILLGRIIEESIQKMVMSTIDQVSNHNLLVEEGHPGGSCDDILKKQVLRAVVSDSISNSLYNLDKLEDFAVGRLQNVDVNKINLRLQELLLEGGQQPQQQIDSINKFCPRVIISSRSNCPSFEFVAGESNSKFQKEGSSSLYVTATPFIFIRSDTLLALDDDQYVNNRGSNATEKKSSVTTSKYNVKIGRCSHTVLFKSTSSGCIVGEAKVEIHITPISNNSSSTSCNEKGLYNCSKTKEDDSTPRRPPKVVDVRACQMNVTPRKIQNRLDFYSSSKYGNEDLTLMVKMRTSQALHSSPHHQEQDDANPMVMDVQVVLEP